MKMKKNQKLLFFIKIFFSFFIVNAFLDNSHCAVSSPATVITDSSQQDENHDG
jgi:hypothetical protein